jgi:UDP-N-acetylmuramoyl-tripeptide--D-alanyl-D-alanine ligase
VRRRSLAEVAAAVGGAVVPADAGGAAVVGVAIDSREVGPSELFVALPGERADGHRFVADALARGAAAALVRAGAVEPGVAGPLLEVDDPRRALMNLARDERSRFEGAVIGITGSTGKTCTKDFTAAVVGERLRVVASERSFNNEVGLPLTILRSDAGTQALVCELGARGPGHIRLLCEVARPAIGVVTNVGVAHMELFGSPQALRDAKAELPEALTEDGTAVLNADDPAVRGYAGRTRGRVVLYGTAGDAHVRAEGIAMAKETGRATFDLIAPNGRTGVELPVAGEHMVPNALAAAAVGHALGLPIGAVGEGLRGAAITPGRMQVRTTPEGLRVLDDSYNANPASMAAALKAARWMAGDARFVAVLGPMAELGPIADEEHERIGELLARLGVDALVAVGPEAKLIAVGAEREGVEPERIVRVDDAEGAVRAVRTLAGAGDIVLVKASRVAGLERVTRSLERGVSG